MNKAQLEALIQREAEKPPYMRHGYAIDTMATGNFKAGASLLAPALLEALGALEYIKSGCPTNYRGCTCIRDTAIIKLQRIKELLGGGK